MSAIRIVLLIANGVWLLDFAYQGASHVYYVATYPTTHEQTIFSSVFLAATVVSSCTLAANIAYIWRSRPHAAFRIVLLIANGVWLAEYAVEAPFSVYVLATHDHDYRVAEAIATRVVCFFILAGNFAYIWRSRPHAHEHSERGPAHRTRKPLG